MNKFIPMFLITILFFSSCAYKKNLPPVDPKVFSWVQSTKKDSPMTGKASFWPAEDGVKIRVVVTGAPAGTHGIHIHEKGECGDEGEAAGSHFNPDKAPHGNVLKDGVKKVHPGDLGNIRVDSTGMGSLEVFVPELTLDREQYGIAGRSIIIHEKMDDFGQPTGNAGGRIACAVIPIPAEQCAPVPETKPKKRFWLL